MVSIKSHHMCIFIEVHYLAIMVRTDARLGGLKNQSYHVQHHFEVEQATDPCIEVSTESGGKILSCMIKTEYIYQILVLNTSGKG